MKRKSKRKSIYSAKKTRKPIRHPMLLSFAALLALGLVMASVFALPGETFTVDSENYRLTYEVLTDPDEATGEGGTAALIQYEYTGTDTLRNGLSVTVPETVENTVEVNGEKTTHTYTVTVIGNRLDGVNPVGAFEGAGSVEDVSLPASILEIRERAFRDATILDSLSGLAENSSVTIAEGAFHGCCFLPETELPDDKSRNPKPFGDKVISDFKLEYRGVESSSQYWYTYADSYAKSIYIGNIDPKRLFEGMPKSLVISVTVEETGYELQSLQRISSENETDLIPDTGHAIEFQEVYNASSNGSSANGSGYYVLPACKTEEEIAAWKQAPAVAVIAASTNTEAIPTITTDSQLNASPGEKFEIQLEAVNSAGATTEWMFHANSVKPDGISLNQRSGILSGTLAEGTYNFRIRMSNGYSFHDKSFTLTVSGDGTEEPDTPTSEPLPAPGTCEWEFLPYTNTIIRAVWKSVENADRYIVQLYKDGQKTGEPVDVAPLPAPMYDFTDIIEALGEGNYYFSVISVSNNDAYTNSEPAISEVYAYTVDTPVEQHTITASTEGGGSITPSGEIRIDEGGSLTFTVTADKYYQLVSLIVDGTNLGRRTSYTFFDVTADHTIKAVFQPVSNRVINMSSSYPAGEDITFTAYGDGMDNSSPVAGDIRWQPLSWNLDGENSVYFGAGEITGTIVGSGLTVGDHTIQIIFVMQEFNGTEWENVEDVDYDTREMTFEVEESSSMEDPAPEDGATDGEEDSNDPTQEENDPTEPTDQTDEENSDSAGDAGGDSSTITNITETVTNYFTNPQTGEILPARVISAAALLALTGGVMILLSRRKAGKTRVSRHR